MLQEALPMDHAYDILARRMEEALFSREHLVLALDGRSASGKTTLAALLSKRFGADVIHMDDFFLPLSLRTPKRLAEPGGNVHYERFLQEIIQPLIQADTHPFCPRGGALMPRLCTALPVLTWERFDCSSGSFAPNPCRTSGQPLLIIEGAYSMRPEFRPAYDLLFFLTASASVQQERIIARNGKEGWKNFRDKWIPMEEKYFSHYQIADCCEMTLES